MSGIREVTGGFEADYTHLAIGYPAGDTHVVECPKCGRPGLRWKGTRKVVHRLFYRKDVMGKEQIVLRESCASALPEHARDAPKNLGFPLCPKEWL